MSNNLSDTTPSGNLGLALGLGALISNLSQQQQYNNLVAAHIAQGMTYEQAVAAVHRALAPMWAEQHTAYLKKRRFWMRLVLCPLALMVATAMFTGLGYPGDVVLGTFAAVGTFLLIGARTNS